MKIWRSEGLVSPPIVAEAVEEYREEEDVLADFVTDEIEANPDGRVAKKLMFERYQTWATENQIRQPYSAKGLARRLRDRGYRDHRVATGRYWVGLAMKPVRTSFSAGASLL